MKTLITSLILFVLFFTVSCKPVQSAPTASNLIKTATFTASPTQTVIDTPSQLCDDLSVDVPVVDITTLNGLEMNPGRVFLKTWIIRNSGSCSWGKGYRIIFSYGDRMTGQPQTLLGSVAPGQEAEISVQFTAPTKAGEYISAWIMVNASGIPFGEYLIVKVIVR